MFYKKIITFDVEEAVEVRQRDTAVDRVPAIRQLVVCVEPLKVVLAVLKLEQINENLKLNKTCKTLVCILFQQITEKVQCGALCTCEL